jgi:hypothetical protein
MKKNTSNTQDRGGRLSVRLELSSQKPAQALAQIGATTDPLNPEFRSIWIDEVNPLDFAMRRVLADVRQPPT